MIDIRLAALPHDLDIIRTLFVEYATALGADLSYQHFDEELAGLPGKYAEPAGRLMLAWMGDEAVGCVALRPIDRQVCEMKRLYVRPAARGQQAGRGLVERICEEARKAGYERINLDTLASLTAAVQLYRDLGFYSIDPYIFNPSADVVYLARDLSMPD